MVILHGVTTMEPSPSLPSAQQQPFGAQDLSTCLPPCALEPLHSSGVAFAQFFASFCEQVSHVSNPCVL